MKNASLALFAGFALMACAPPAETPAAAPGAAASEPAPSTEAAAPPAPEASAPPVAPPEDACGALKLVSLIGKPITSEGVPAPGPGVRHIRPDSQVTMDFRPDRLNIDVDANDIITGLRCT